MDTLASLHVTASALGTGVAAETVGDNERHKSTNIFVSFVFETFCTWGPSPKDFLQ